MLLKKLFLSFIFVCFISCFSYKANASQHAKMASQFLDDGLKISENDKLTKKQKLQKLVDNYANSMNLAWNAKMALGRPYQQLNKQEQQEYIKEYSKYILYVWIPTFNFNRKTGVKLTVLDKTEKINDTDENVKIVIEDPNSSKYDVIVRTRITKDNKFQLLDFTIEGINLSTSYRAQFTSYMEKHDNDPHSIIEYLRNQNQHQKSKSLFNVNID